MSPTLTLDPQLGWVPAIPEPFWYRGWRTLFRYRPACYRCASVSMIWGTKPLIFRWEEQWNQHYVLTHLKEDLEHEGNQD